MAIAWGVQDRHDDEDLFEEATCLHRPTGIRRPAKQCGSRRSPL